MKIEVHAPDGPDLTIPLPNALLFSPTLWNRLLKFSSRSKKSIPEIPSETIHQACRVIKEYVKIAGSWELVQVESADGATGVISV